MPATRNTTTETPAAATLPIRSTRAARLRRRRNASAPSTTTSSSGDMAARTIAETKSRNVGGISAVACSLVDCFLSLSLVLVFVARCCTPRALVGQADGFATAAMKRQCGKTLISRVGRHRQARVANQKHLSNQYAEIHHLDRQLI